MNKNCFSKPFANSFFAFLLFMAARMLFGIRFGFSARAFASGIIYLFLVIMSCACYFWARDEKISMTKKRFFKTYRMILCIILVFDFCMLFFTSRLAIQSLFGKPESLNFFCNVNLRYALSYVPLSLFVKNSLGLFASFAASVKVAFMNKDYILIFFSSILDFASDIFGLAFFARCILALEKFIYQPSANSVSKQCVLNAIKSCFCKFFTFKGYAKRSEYFIFMLFNYVVISLLLSVYYNCQFFFSMYESRSILFIIYFYFFVVIPPSISVTVRRFHDAGFNGACSLIPIVSFYLVMLPSKTGRLFDADTKATKVGKCFVVAFMALFVFAFINVLRNAYWMF